MSLDQNCIPRLVVMPTLAVARRALYYYSVGVIVFSFLVNAIGIIMYAFYYECDPIKAKVLFKLVHTKHFSAFTSQCSIRL